MNDVLRKAWGKSVEVGGWKTFCLLDSFMACLGFGYPWFHSSATGELVSVDGPVKVRDGIPHVREKLVAGKSVTVGFLGGSITQDSAEGAFAKRVPQWLEERFPGARVPSVNAGLGETDSEWGAKRLDRDVLEAKPDVVFVESAVNDGGRDSIADIERVVRKVRAFSATSDIGFLYAITDSTIKILARRRMS